MGRTRTSTVAFAAAYIALVAGLFLALGGLAYAQTSAGDQYGKPNTVAGVVVTETTATPSTESTTALPNTGLSLLVVALVGGSLVAVGVMLRRRERRQD